MAGIPAESRFTNPEPSEQRVVIGVLDDEKDLDALMESLRQAGFTLKKAGESVTTMEDNPPTKHENTLTAPENLVDASATGAIIGGTVGLLMEIAGTVVPGSLALVSAGPLVPFAVGIGVGATIGGIAGVIKSFGFADTIAHRYQQVVRDGAMLISVHCNNEESARLAKSIMRISAAHDIEECSEIDAENLEAYSPENSGLRL